MVPQDQLSPGTGEPFAVVSFCKADSFAATYADESGKLHTSILLRVGGRWHIAPNGENFASTLKALRPGTPLANTLEAAYERSLDDAMSAAVKSVANIPKDDAVDPLGGE
jgi:hypothetical protein